MIHTCAWELKPNFPFQWALSCILSVVRERMQQSYALKYSVLWLSFYAWTVPYSQPNQRPQTGYFHSVVRAWKLTVVNYLSIAFQARIKITKCVESHWNARWMRAFAYIITTYNSFTVFLVFSFSLMVAIKYSVLRLSFFLGLSHIPNLIRNHKLDIFIQLRVLGNYGSRRGRIQKYFANPKKIFRIDIFQTNRFWLMVKICQSLYLTAKLFAVSRLKVSLIKTLLMSRGHVVTEMAQLTKFGQTVWMLMDVGEF